MSEAVFFRTGYNYDRDAVSLATGLKCEDESLAVQSDFKDSDINEIVRRFGLTGQLPANVRVPQSGDFTGVEDFRSAMDAIRKAEESFAEMPADVRARFQNDPAQFVDFCTAVKDDKLVNIDEMRRLGLAVPAVAAVPEPVPAEVPK